MRIYVFSIAMMLLIGAFCQPNQENKSKKSGNGHGHGQMLEFRPKKRGDIPPHIRKCLNVLCEPGLKCFHGRCKKHDQKCELIRCAAGYRCNHGECIKQMYTPGKAICKPLEFQGKQLRCKNYKNNQNVKNVCAFNKKTGTHADYLDYYSACSDQQCHNNFVYEGPCTLAPRICKENEECMNGICTTFFNDPQFQNNRDCNKNADCKINQYCAGHKCMDQRDLLNFLQSKSETEAILVKM